MCEEPNHTTAKKSWSSMIQYSLGKSLIKVISQSQRSLGLSSMNLYVLCLSGKADGWVGPVRVVELPTGGLEYQAHGTAFNSRHYLKHQ